MLQHVARTCLLSQNDHNIKKRVLSTFYPIVFLIICLLEEVLMERSLFMSINPLHYITPFPSESCELHSVPLLHAANVLCAVEDFLS